MENKQNDDKMENLTKINNSKEESGLTGGLSMNQQSQPNQENKTTENVNQLDVLNAEIEQLKAKNAELEKERLLIYAENQNIIKRTQKEKQEFAKYANDKILKELINPIDHIFMALAIEVNEDESQFAKNLYQGVKMTADELLKVLELHGVKRINPLEEKFDHNFHQAVQQIEDESKESGEIIQVLQAGYLLNGRLIRPANVIIVK